MVDCSVVSTSRRFSLSPSISRWTSSIRPCVCWKTSSARDSASSTMRRRFLLGVLADLVGQALRGEQRVAEVPLVLAVLGDHRFEPQQFLVQPVGLAERLLVVVGHFVQQRVHLVAVVAAHGDAQLGLPQVERGDLHDLSPLSRERTGACSAGVRSLSSFGRSRRGLQWTSSGAGARRRSPCRRGPSWRLPRRPPRSRGSCPSTVRGACAAGTPRPHSRSRSSRSRRKYGRTASGSSKYGGSSISPARRTARQRGRAARRRPGPRRSRRRAWSARRPGPPGPGLPGDVPASAAARSTASQQVDAVDRVDAGERDGRLARLVRLEVADQVPAQRRGRRCRAIFCSASWTRFSPKSSWPGRGRGAHVVDRVGLRHGDQADVVGPAAGTRRPRAPSARERRRGGGRGRLRASQAEKRRGRRRRRPRATSENGWSAVATRCRYFFNCVSIAFTWAAY